MSLKYYQTERETFKEEYKTYIDTQAHVEQIVHKLCRHFGIPKIRVNFTKCRQGSAAYYSGWHSIDFSWGKKYPIDIGTICHEMGHYYLDKKGKPHGHTKRLMKIVGRMIAYCKSKDYWGYSYILSEDDLLKLHHPLDWKWNNVLTMVQRKEYDKLYPYIESVLPSGVKMATPTATLTEYKAYIKSCELVNLKP